MTKINTSNSLTKTYDELYKKDESEWIRICGKYKASNIIEVCGSMNFQKVMECGAGDGSILYYLKNSEQFNQFYAIEISDSGIEKLNAQIDNKLIKVLKFDGYNIPFEDKYFDLVYCSHVIEHVEHPRALLREIKRVSKNQVFEIPLDYKINVDESINHFLSYGHISIYTPSLFKYLLKSEGFNIKSELFKHSSDEVINYSWAIGSGKLKPEHRIKFISLKFKRILKRILWGDIKFKEFGFSSYTCLTDSNNKNEIL